MTPPQIENTNQYGSTTAPVYLRLQKRAEAYTKRPPRPSFRWRPLALRLLALAAVGFLGALATQLIRDDPRFRLHSVELRGAHYLGRSEVEEVFQADQEERIYQIPLEQRRRELEEIPWVRSATVTRVLPDQLWVTVEERVPVAFLWTRQGLALVDGEGIVMDSPPVKTSLTFPVVRGISADEPLPQRREKMRHFVTLMEELGRGDPRFPEKISEVDLEDPQDVRVVVADSSQAIQLHLGAEDFLARFMQYVRQIEQWRQEFGEIQSIDLRYAGQVVIHAGQPQGPRLEKPKAP